MADITISLPLTNTTVYGNSARANYGFNRAYRIPYTLLPPASSTDGDDVIVTLERTPVNWVIDRAIINVTTAFTVSGTLAAILGYTGDPDGILATQNIKTKGAKIASGLAAAAAATGTTAVNLTCKFDLASGDNPTDISAGELIVYLNLIDLDRIN